MCIRDRPFREISSFFSRPCYFMNDANAGAYGEGMEMGNSFFYLSLSNTVGGALFADGEINKGSHFHCGEAGHMTIVPGGELCCCGKRGCADVYCSAGRLAEAGGGKLEAFFEKLRKGDPKIRLVWDRYTDHLAVLVNNLYTVSYTHLDVYKRQPYTQALLSAIPVPDIHAKKEEIILQGEVPSPMDPPKGCLFCTRCPHASDRCRREAPELKRCV